MEKEVVDLISVWVKNPVITAQVMLPKWVAEGLLNSKFLSNRLKEEMKQ
jgi:hypothetical protein